MAASWQKLFSSATCGFAQATAHDEETGHDHFRLISSGDLFMCVCVRMCVCVLGKTYILQLPTTCIYLLESPAGEPLWLNRHIASPYASAEAPSAAKPTAHMLCPPHFGYRVLMDHEHVYVYIYPYTLLL